MLNIKYKTTQNGEQHKIKTENVKQHKIKTTQNGKQQKTVNNTKSKQ